LKALGPEKTFSIEVRGVMQNEASGRVQVSEPVRFSFSQYPADDYVVARQVGVPFDVQRAPDTFIRDIRTFERNPFLLGRESYCFNCHNFSSKLGTNGKLAYQVRYLGPESHDLRTYLAVYDFDHGTGWRARLPYDVQMTTFCAWSPDGTKLAISANQYIVAAEPITLETQMAGENTSDIGIYDVEQGTTWLLPGADREDRLEIHPEWTPDGKQIVFATAAPGRHPAFVPFDLAIIPYNDGEGGKPTLIPGASANGRSNYYPRFSPDGRWFCFNESDGGDLIRSSSDLYLMPATLDAPPHKLECNVPFAADSWHSWSSNSRWILFASKREDGTYARLYMTEIDDQGHASPAIRLPEREDLLESFNIPEFVAHVPPVSEHGLYEAIRVEQEPRDIVPR
jgi:Tol biopolymer transport system component